MHQSDTCRPRRVTVLLLPALLALACLPAYAGNDLFVTNLNDSGPGSLRQAMLDVDQGTNNILFANSLEGTIELQSELPWLLQSTGLVGPGADKVTVDANQHGRLLTLGGTTENLFIVQGLTLTGGSVDDIAAGIWLHGGHDLLLEDVRLIDNVAFSEFDPHQGGGLYVEGSTEVLIRQSVIAGNQAAYGAGILSLGLLTVVESTVHGNVATEAWGGGIASTGEVVLINSTVSGNIADAPPPEIAVGGGIHIGGSGTLEMRSSTITANRADAGPGIAYVDSASTVTVVNSIVAGNSFLGPVPVEGNCLTSLGMTNGTNFEGAFDCGFDGGVDWQNTDPQLLPLAYAGGPTPTHVPRPSSLVIDRGDELFCVALDNDQRGFDRSVDGNDNAVATCDIGALEFVPEMDEAILIDGFESGDTSAWQ